MATQIGFGIQPGTYFIDITSGTFISYNSKSSSGSFHLLGTWEGGLGAGTLEISGQWSATAGKKVPVGSETSGHVANITILDDITTSWTTNSTTLQDQSANLINNGGLGQTLSAVSPIKIYTSVIKGENRWRIVFEDESWYSYDKNNPSKKYFFDYYDQVKFFSGQTYTTTDSTSGTFFDVSANAYYSSFGGINGTFSGENIIVKTAGETEITDLGGLVLKSKTSGTSTSSSLSTSVSPTSFVVPIPAIESETIQETETGIFYKPDSTHIGRNIIKCQTIATKDQSASDGNNNIYKITCAPPGLFPEENYVIVPNTEPNKSWKYFYHSNSDGTSVEKSNNGTFIVNNVQAEFPTSTNPENSENWITGDLNDNLSFDINIPATSYNIFRNKYFPRESKMFAWSGKRHFGIIIGEPGSNNVKKYLIY